MKFHVWGTEHSTNHIKDIVVLYCPNERRTFCKSAISGLCDGCGWIESFWGSVRLVWPMLFCSKVLCELPLRGVWPRDESRCIVSPHLVRVSCQMSAFVLRVVVPRPHTLNSHYKFEITSYNKIYLIEINLGTTRSNRNSKSHCTTVLVNCLVEQQSHHTIY